MPKDCLEKICERIKRFFDPLRSLWSKPGIFLLIVFVCFIIVFARFIIWQFDRENIVWFLVVVIPLLYLFVRVRGNYQVGLAEAVLLLSLMVLFLIGFGPIGLRNNLNKWSLILEERLKTSPFSVVMGSFSISVSGLLGNPGTVTSQRPFSATTVPPEFQVVLAQRQPLNVIRNGDFLIPMNSPLSPWGYGHYSDPLHAREQRWDFVWINFLNADIDAQIAQTEIGPALRIENRTGNVDHKIGIMEQYISHQPGTYQLSMRVRGEGVKPSALWCTTTDDWEPFRDKKTRTGLQNLDFPGGAFPGISGTFSWTNLVTEIQLKGNFTTFTIVSKGSGILYLTDISLIRVRD